MAMARSRVSLQNTFLNFDDETDASLPARSPSVGGMHRRAKSDSQFIPPRTPLGTESHWERSASHEVSTVDSVTCEQLALYRTLFEADPNAPNNISEFANLTSPLCRQTERKCLARERSNTPEHAKASGANEASASTASDLVDAAKINGTSAETTEEDECFAMDPADMLQGEETDSLPWSHVGPTPPRSWNGDSEEEEAMNYMMHQPPPPMPVQMSEPMNAYNRMEYYENKPQYGRQDTHNSYYNRVYEDEDEEEEEEETTQQNTRSSSASVGATSQMGEHVEFSHSRVPRETDLKKKYDTKGEITTIMLRNVPNRYTQRNVIDELYTLRFHGTYDFLYLPIDKATGSNVGYVFINFFHPDDAARCMNSFENYPWKKFQKYTKKLAKACPAHIQGLENNRRHYADRAVKESKIPQYRPLILARGEQNAADYRPEGK